MSVQTSGKTLKLIVGNEFEIGTVRGKVSGVTSRSVMIEIEGQSYEPKPAEKTQRRDQERVLQSRLD